MVEQIEPALGRVDDQLAAVNKQGKHGVTGERGIWMIECILDKIKNEDIGAIYKYATKAPRAK